MRSTLLERDAALAQLDAALREAVEQGGVALVSGEAGIGKTSLVRQFARERGQDVRVLWGLCDALFTPRPLGPVLDILGQLEGGWNGAVGSDTDRVALFGALLNELRQTPSMAVFEDVHWADEATLDLLKFLGRRMASTPSLLVMTFRDDEVGPRHPLRSVLGDLTRSSGCRRIALSPLSEQAVRTLIGDRPVDAAALHRQSGGNAFFVTEVLASGSEGIPPTVRDAVLARAARLSPSGRAVLEAAAIVGPRVEPWLLAAVTGAEAGAAEEAMAAGTLVAEGDVLAFRHEIGRQAILEAISPQRRLTLHRLVLEALEASPATSADVARLAHHAEAAQHWDGVRRYAPVAAERAAAVHAHRQAAAHYAQALRVTTGLAPEEHARLLERYAVECNIIEQRPEGIAARRQALAIRRSLGDRLKEGENLALMVSMHFGLGQADDAERAIEAAVAVLEALPPSRELALAYRMRAALYMLNRDLAEAIVWGEKAIGIAEQVRDYESLAGAYNAIGSALIVTDYARGQAALERSRAIAVDAGLEMAVANAYNNLGSASGEVYRYREADPVLREGVAYCVERDLDVSRLYMQAWLALTHLHLGRWREAGETAIAVLNHHGVSPITRVMAWLALGRLRARRGDPEVWTALDEALVLAEATQTLQRIAPVRAARAEAAWLAGDHERATAEAQAAYDLAAEKRHPWFTGELAFWRRRAGDEIALPGWTATPFEAQAAGEWGAAAQTWEQLGCPYEQAQALADGDEAARSEALAIFERLGARPAAEWLLRSGRVGRASRTPAWMYDGVSDREREVAALIAQGRSNREIAAAMTVGVKTVETYVTRILNKLGLDSRVQIALWAVEKGLGPRGEPPTE